MRGRSPAGDALVRSQDGLRKVSSSEALLEGILSKRECKKAKRTCHTGGGFKVVGWGRGSTGKEDWKEGG